MSVISREKLDKMLDVIHDINLESDVTALRKKFMTYIDELIPHDRSFFDLAYEKHTKVAFFDPVSINIDQKTLEAFFKEYIIIDPMFWFFSQNKKNIYRDSDYIGENMLETSAFYKEWMKPLGIYYGMGSVTKYEDILYGSVTLWRSKESGDFTAEEIMTLCKLNEHLALRFNHLFPAGVSPKYLRNYIGNVTQIYHLTKREHEIAFWVYEGLTTRQISEKLYISESTVKKHLHNIFTKLKISNRSQLIKAIYKNISASENDD